MSSRQYQYRKANGLCVSCGTQDDRTLSGKVECEKCAANTSIKNKETYEFWKKHGVCCRCGCDDSRTRAGKTVCRKCLDYDNAMTMARKHMKNPDLRYRWRDWAAHKKIPIFRSEFVEYGKCYICGVPLDGAVRADGTPAHVCQKHYEILLKSIEHCQQHPNTIEALRNHHWNAMNDAMFSGQEAKRTDVRPKTWGRIRYRRRKPA